VLQAHYINDPEHWRRRAVEMRVLAENATDVSARETMLRIAEDYEELARRAQNRSAGRASSAPHSA
jgi:hypothetical protein